MKGLLLAGGHGTRMRPLTYTGNKHTLPIANKPMLLYGLEHLRSAGIREVGVVLGPVKEGIQEMLGDGSALHLHVTYIDQPEPRGLAHAVLISEQFIDNEPFVMYLGDNLLKEGVSRFIRIFESTRADCVVGVTPVNDPSRFGVAELKDGKPVRLVEKPKSPKSNLALIGIYVFGPPIFEAVKKIRPSWRNELEITDAIQELIDSGKRVEAELVEGWWKDTGRPEDLLEANQLVLTGMKSNIDGELSEQTSYVGNLSIGKGTRLHGRVNIKGPVIIGDNCNIGPDVYIGPYTAIGDECTLNKVEIENSIVMKGCSVRSGKRIVDSLIGSYSTITNQEESIPQGQRLIIGERSFAQI